MLSRGVFLAVLLAQVAALAVEPPSYLRSISDQRDIAGVNENDRTLADGIRQVDERVDDLPTLDGDNAWTGDNTFSGSLTTSGTTNLNGPTNARSTFTFQADAVGPQIVQAWAHFVTTGTFGILDSVGVSSVTYLGTGSYRVNMSTPMANNRYAVFVSWSRTSGAGADRFCSVSDDTDRNRLSVDVLCTNLSGTSADTNQVHVGIVGQR